MLLTEAQKSWMITNRQVLEAILKSRIDEVRDQVLVMPRGTERDSKIDLVQELLMWLRDIQALSQETPKHDPVV